MEFMVFAAIMFATILASLPFNVGTAARDWCRAKFPGLVEGWTADPNFVFWTAHGFFAAFVVVLFELYFPGHAWEVVAAGTWCAFVKEFFWDRLFENPMQAFTDNISDLAGYELGMIPAALFVTLLPPASVADFLAGLAHV